MTKKIKRNFVSVLVACIMCLLVCIFSAGTVSATAASAPAFTKAFGTITATTTESGTNIVATTTSGSRVDSVSAYKFGKFEMKFKVASASSLIDFNFTDGTNIKGMVRLFLNDTCLNFVVYKVGSEYIQKGAVNQFDGGKDNLDYEATIAYDMKTKTFSFGDGAQVVVDEQFLPTSGKILINPNKEANLTIMSITGDDAVPQAFTKVNGSITATTNESGETNIVGSGTGRVNSVATYQFGRFEMKFKVASASNCIDFLFYDGTNINGFVRLWFNETLLNFVVFKGNDTANEEKGAVNQFDGGQDAPDYEATLAYDMVTKTFSFGGTAQVVVDEQFLPTSGNICVRTYAATNLTINSIEGKDCAAKLEGATVTVGEDLTMTYSVSISDEEVLANISKVAMQFTVNEETVTVNAGTKNGDYYTFAYEGIAPQHMSDLIDARLVLIDGETVTLLAEKLGYSVKQNAQNLLNKSPSEQLQRLLTDMLYYGAEAQQYRGYNLENLATDGVEGMASANVVVADATDLVLGEKTEDKAYFKAAGVWFDNVNKLYVKIADGFDVASLSVKINGVDAEIVDGVVYTNGMIATEFDNVYTFELYQDDVLVHTVEYSVKSYVYAKQNGGNAMAELASALYTYGKSAVAYAASLGN